MAKYKKLFLDIVAKFAKVLPKYEKMLEGMWNTNWKQSVVLYNARGIGLVEVKDLLKINDKESKELESVLNTKIINHDDSEEMKVIKIAKFVNKHITYKYDINNYNRNEYWASPYEVYKRKIDDCDGYAFLILKLMELAGIPAYRRKIVAGSTRGYGGHAYIIYLSRKDNEWYVIEGSLRATESFLNYGIVPHRERGLYKEMWFTFNEEKSWTQKDTLI